MVIVRHERSADIAAREAVLDRAFGECRHEKPSQRLRDGRYPARGLSFVAADNGRVIGTVRLWNVTIGGCAALLLGPLAVDPHAQSRGVGAALMRRALGEARRLGHEAVLLVGDEAYYGRFGFSAEKTSGLTLAGRQDRRLLALELSPGALDGAAGVIQATGDQLRRRTARSRQISNPAARAA
jgi:predicted N-acetyltransferase YhbS